MGKMDGKVAFVTGVARGQGRSHAVQFAQAGGDVIGIDLLEPDAPLAYPLGSEGELAETVRLVEAAGGRIVTRRADVRDLASMETAAREGLAELGQIDVVCASAGIFAMSPLAEMTSDQWDNMIATNLTGVFNTIRVTVPSMIERGAGGSVIITGSSSSTRGYMNCGHYVAAKHGVVGLMRTLANELAPHNIRVNVINPTNVDTPLLQNSDMYGVFRPDLDQPTQADAIPAFTAMHALSIPWIDVVDVSNAVLWLASDEARYVTGAQIPVDGGATEKTGG